MPEAYKGPLEQIDACRWRIPRSCREDMRVDGIIYADEKLMRSIVSDKSPEQVANVATLPGIVGASLAMPDIHWGYGFCIGGVAATDPQQGGVISPGGVGYDINCGVRLMRTALTQKQVQPRIERLIDALFANVPCGVGRDGKHVYKRKELARILEGGSAVVVEQGLGWPDDIEATEAHGRLNDADPDAVSDRAYERGKAQCGTLGSGNHFLEVQVVETVFDEPAAEALGLAMGQIAVMIHSGSRGLGYQVCDESLHALRGVPAKYGITLPDRQLACAPVDSKEGRRYLGAMRAAANYAWANRQILTHLARETFADVFDASAESLEMGLVYDVAHNIAKIESYEIGGQPRMLCVHRKGATRAFPPGHPEVSARYRAVGQPVLIPGDMGRASYVLVGQPAAMTDTFGSACHGAGRRMSRSAAIRAATGRRIDQGLLSQGIVARARGRTGLAEEQPDAYKDVSQVVEVVHCAGLARKVARLRP
ncbi:MAG: RtcB family protein, partial [Phycisphaerae bacterium]|nr:RtcB family protein [Phycisphaerae bacterium]